MDLLAPFFLEFSESVFQATQLSSELLDTFICARNLLFVLGFSFFGCLKCSYDTFVEALPFLKRHFHVELKVLIVEDKLLGVFRGFIISAGKGSYTRINLLKILNAVLRFLHNLLELRLLLLKQLHQRSDAFLSHVLCQFCSRFGPLPAVGPEAFHLLRKEPDFDGVVLLAIVYLE